MFFLSIQLHKHFSGSQQLTFQRSYCGYTMEIEEEASTIPEDPAEQHDAQSNIVNLSHINVEPQTQSDDQPLVKLRGSSSKEEFEPCVC